MSSRKNKSETPDTKRIKTKYHFVTGSSSSTIITATEPPSTFDSIPDDAHDKILDFVGRRSYVVYGILSKRYKQIYLAKKDFCNKETFFYGYAPIQDIIKRLQEEFKLNYFYDHASNKAKGVVYFNRKDLLNWVAQEAQEESKVRPNFLWMIMSSLAAESGNTDILEELLSSSGIEKIKGEGEHCSLFIAAAHGGQIRVIKWLLAHGVTNCDYDACAYEAAKSGHLNLLQWLVNKEDINCNPLIDFATEKGHLHIIKWLRARGCHWDEWTFACAASDAVRRGTFEVLEYLKEHNCPWDKEAFTEVLLIVFRSTRTKKNGQIPVLQWLWDNGCPRGNKTLFVDIEDIERFMKPNVRTWLIEHGFIVMFDRLRLL